MYFSVYVKKTADLVTFTEEIFNNKLYFWRSDSEKITLK